MATPRRANKTNNHPAQRPWMSRAGRAERKIRKEANLCTACGNRPPHKRGWCLECYSVKYELAKTNTLRRQRNLRNKALALLGACCSCCGETEDKFLSFDHANNDGNMDRLSVTKYHMLYDIISGQRKDIQILCFNCNIGKYHNGGVCPHKSK